MTDILITENGKIRKYDDVELAEKIVEKVKTKDPWEVIDDLVRVWAHSCPDDVEAISINLRQYRETQHDKEFATTMNGKDQERRFKLAFPKHLMLMIRSQYKADDLQMDSKFFNEFAKRYPSFKVAERI